jgi:sulfonate transport system permease protein
VKTFFQQRRWRGLVLPLLILALWAVATDRAWVSPLVLVPFGELFHTARDPEVLRSLWAGLGASIVRLVQGSLIGIAAGLMLGIGLGLSRAFDRIMGPSFHAVRQVAIFAWIPLLTAWFGNGDLCKIVFIALASFYPVVMGTYEGIRSVPDALVEVGRVLCFSRAQMLRRIVLPAALPSIVTALQLSFIFSWFAAIGAEYLIGKMSSGIGAVVMTAQEHLRTDVVLLGVFVISGVGITLNTLLRRVPRVLFRWQEPA